MYLESSSGDFVLRCAYCASEYTHQQEIVVFNRGENPEGQAMRARVDWGTVTIDDCMDGNPSHRRQGVVIACTCERCSGVSELTIGQHEGQTIINVRRAGFRHRFGEFGVSGAAKG